MPKKIRELIRELEASGFSDRGGKGSHRNFLHASGVVLTISGRPGDDAKPYQVKLVREKIRESRR
jgi:predicted RNA binding protein YcfA (HicA-like mRNA interferase family)